MYKYLRRIFEHITGYPADPKLSTEYIWAWNFTGIRPDRIISEDPNDFPTFVFKKGPVSYFCSADPEGQYVIGNVDTDGFCKEETYKRRALLIAKYLGKRPKNCSKETAVIFCAKAVCVGFEHKAEQVNTSSIDLISAEHSIISFC